MIFCDIKLSVLNAALGGVALAATLLLPSVNALAATATWSGGGANNRWSTAPANWGGSAPNAAGDYLVFAGSAPAHQHQ